MFIILSCRASTQNSLISTFTKPKTLSMTIDLSILKQQLKQNKELCIHRFQHHEPISSITRQLVASVDEILISLFYTHDLEQEGQFCLLAMGGYGRRELQLHSDIDLLLLYKEAITPLQQKKIEQFIQNCWDIGLEISHQLSTPHLYADLAQNDLSAISSLLDVRLLCGTSALLEELYYQTHALHMWDSRQYFIAKVEEQHQRYAKYDETAYNLEPNVKNGPGGLRDLHILLNIGKRHFSIKKFSEGINHGFFTDKEYEELIQCRRFLWRVRFALHWIARKKEDRLLFDYQAKLAPFFGYQDTPEILAIEQFMKAYFKMIKRTRELNDMLLQWFAEAIVYPEKQILIPLDDSFQLSNQYIEIKHPRVFSDHPEKLLTLFVWMSKLPEIQGVRAGTIRMIHQNLYLINHQFRTKKINTEQFITLFKTPNSPFDALRHMNRYGVLGQYLQCFQAIIGQMQYDLFHVYTVDQHALFVIRNIARFLTPEKNQTFQLCRRLIKSIPKCEILYLAALFHDIAKGRGGDHSQLGADEAQQFATTHQLNDEDSALLIWLVRHHLLMSHTAQRKDIYDPQTIAAFCQQLPHSHYLDYLYLLTVADICATNPSLWNAWKDSLLKELYFATKLAMHQEEKLLSNAVLIHEKRTKAMIILKERGLEPHLIQQLWDEFNERYFIHESPAIIARHTESIISCKQYPLVLILPHHSEGGTEVFIYMPHLDARVAITTATLSNYRVTIQEANILTCKNHFDLDTYVILDEQNHTLVNEQRINELKHALIKNLNLKSQLPSIIKRRVPRLHAHFNFIPQISFHEDAKQRYTQLFFIASDRPGLLASISRIFLHFSIHVHHAKIATAGERVEDTFYISTQHNQPLTAEEQEQLMNSLKQEVTPPIFS